MSEFTQRTVVIQDMQALWGLVRGAAADIPFPIQSEAEQERALSEIMACCASNESRVALDANGVVIGALLARRDQLDWGLFNGGAVNIAAIVVAAEYRDKGVGKALLEALIGAGGTLYINVKPTETQGLAAIVKELGFASPGEGAPSDLYKFEPPAKAA